MTAIRILDGGMSRELARLGAPLRQPEWSALALIETPEIVRQAHLAFIAAGARVISTNSYALVPFHIGEDRFSEQGPILIALAGRLAREAADAAPADRRPLVAGSLPPIFGSYAPESFDLARAPPYLNVLVENLRPHVDLWLAETLSLIAEAEAARAAVAGTGKPLWVSFTLADAPGAEPSATPRLRSGETVEAAAAWAAGSGAEALLFNCSRPEVMAPAIEIAVRVLHERRANLEIGAYANALETSQAEGGANETLHGVRPDLTGDAYGAFARRWAAAGATLIGGCCGVGAAHIARLAELFG
jgi:S-methylmethionine-dependent homocysteine/selenocysteine methylase